MMDSDSPARQPIAVVGVSALFPGSLDANGFWRDILAGRDLMREVPESHWLINDYYDPDPTAPDKTYAKRGAFLDPIDFDALGWGVPPSTIPATDTSQLLALIVAQQVLQDFAGAANEGMDRARISVILGVTSAQDLLSTMVSRLQRPVWVKALRESGLPELEVQAACDRIAAHYVPWQESSFPGLLGNVVAGRIANRLNLGGTNCVTDAACASTFSALSMSINELQLGHSDLVISGGVDTLNDIFMYMCFSKTPALSPSGDCRPFSDRADGTMLGEGVGMVALKRLVDAERDGDRIYALIRGLGTSSDGRSKSVYAPVSAGQAVALRRAYDLAGYGPETVELMEAHGTGTKAGDAAEFEALRVVFEEARPALEANAQNQWCALGSVKSQIGHTKAAAGAAGLFKAIMALHHQVLPPSIKIDAPNPKLEIEQSPFYLSTRTRPWIRGSAHPRRASVSAFGFGGSNFHITLEEYRGPAPAALRMATQALEWVLLLAPTLDDLLARAHSLLTSDVDLAAVARQSHLDWDAATVRAYRLSVVAKDVADLRAKLETAITRIKTDSTRAFSSHDGCFYGHGDVPGKLAFVFAGQGSQYLDMGADLAMNFPLARGVWDRAAAFAFEVKTALHEVVFPQPGFGQKHTDATRERLTATRWAQPAIAAVALSQLAIMREMQIEPEMLAGHSFGEIVALHAAGVMDESALLRVARRRGELMGEVAPEPGAMTAISHPIARLRELLREVDAKVCIANHNSPTQIVVAGGSVEIERFEQVLVQRDISFKRLPVGTAFHSPMVAPACAPFASFLDQISFDQPVLPTYSNVSADLHTDDVQVIRRVLADQIVKPVRFVEMIERMYADGARVFVELGPNAVLANLIGATLDERPHSVMSVDRKAKSGVESLVFTLARLAALGVNLRAASLWAGHRLPSAADAVVKHALPISGSNVGKLYPPTGGAAALPKPNPPRVPAPVMPSATTVVALTRASSAIAATTSPAAPDKLPEAQFSPVIQRQDSPQTQSTNEYPTVPDITMSDAFLSAFAQSQTQTADAHAAFQRAMFDSHAAYLRVAESAMVGLSQLAIRQQVNPLAPLSTTNTQVHTRAASGQSDAAPLMHAIEATPSAISVYAAPLVAVATASTQLAPSASVAPAPKAHGLDIAAVMLEVVAEKTGYPADMLNLSMDLEGDLGIDSIKRVEILAALEARAPVARATDRSRLSALHTLGEIVEYLNTSDASAPPQCDAHIQVVPIATQTKPTFDLAALMLQVVAEKTGYPVDMLSLAMDLEGDLGIDSIKRVEILAAVEARAPHAKVSDRAQLSALHTLGEIVEALGGKPASPSALHSIRVDATIERSAAPSGDIAALMLAVVAEKTGYPLDMLNLDMDLEGDLGIDSIKRVEILAAVEARAPSAKASDRTRLSELHTLAEIVAYLGSAASTTPKTIESEDPSASSDTTSHLGRFRVELTPAPVTGLALAGLRGTSVWVTGGGELNQIVVAALVRRGVAAHAGGDMSAACRACIYLGGLRAISNVDEAIAINREAFALARQLAPSMLSAAGVWVSVQDTGGGFGHATGAANQVVTAKESPRVWLSGLSALMKTAALEWPLASVKAIDLERDGLLSTQWEERIVNELLGGGGEIEVALPAAGGRYTLVSVAEPARADAAVIGRGDVVVVSGGARGVTAACIAAWGRESRASFALLGRSSHTASPESLAEIHGEAALKSALLHTSRLAGENWTPAQLSARVHQIEASREIEANLDLIRSSGAQAIYVSVNVSDSAAVARALDSIRAQLGPIRGLVHGAGVLADKSIAEKTDSQFNRVFDTKVLGLRALLQATGEDPLKLLCIFSSVSARCGNTGQADYAMANEVLTKVALAQAAARPSLRVKSLAWGPWEGGMVTPHLKSRFAQLGVPMIPIALGAQFFVDEMREASGYVDVVLGGAPRAEALLFANAHARVDRLEIDISEASHGYLAGHAVNGVPVVPAVLVAEWMSRAARSLRPGLSLVSLHDFKVLKGIRLTAFAGAGDRLMLAAHALPCTNGAELVIKLSDMQGTPMYSARAQMRADVHAPSEALPHLALDAWKGDPLYAQLLFHRGDFELIQQIEGISDHGVGATLHGVDRAGWTSEDWQLDVAALDAGMQMAVVYGQRMLGGPSLPTAIDEIRVCGRAPSAGLIRAAVYKRSVTDIAMTTDILFTDEQGRRLAELRGVHNHALPRH